ncbi:putative xylanase/chitin deacetylase [Acephala macrosclerotiorum]|nr:putative xylanase/chitin deacetylase [Acephala macrosclerotiorum]
MYKFLTSLFLFLSITHVAAQAPFGQVITGCQDPGTIALTFDDGPSVYTPQLLDILSANGVKATFFIVGYGWRGAIDDWSTQWPAILQRIHNEGHQLASHTYTHANLSALSWDAMNAEITQNEQAFLNVLGFFPAYIRPPYLSCNGACMDMMNNLGYHVVSMNLDTKDYINTDPNMIWISMQKFEAGAWGGNIVLVHDIHEQTVASLTQFMIDTIRARGLRPVTVGECLGDWGEGWYRGGR